MTHIVGDLRVSGFHMTHIVDLRGSAFHINYVGGDVGADLRLSIEVASLVVGDKIFSK